MRFNRMSGMFFVAAKHTVLKPSRVISLLPYEPTDDHYIHSLSCVVKGVLGIDVDACEWKCEERKMLDDSVDAKEITRVNKHLNEFGVSLECYIRILFEHQLSASINKSSTSCALDIAYEVKISEAFQKQAGLLQEQAKTIFELHSDGLLTDKELVEVFQKTFQSLSKDCEDILPKEVFTQFAKEIAANEIGFIAHFTSAALKVASSRYLTTMAEDTLSEGTALEKAMMEAEGKIDLELEEIALSEEEDDEASPGCTIL